MLNIFFKPSHIFTVMRPAHGRHFSIKSACCAFPGRLPGLRFTHSLPRRNENIPPFFNSPGCQRQEKNILIQKVNRLGFAWRAADGFLGEYADGQR